VSVLRKGDTFGDQAIINKARHSTAASPGSNASLLVVSQEVGSCRRHVTISKTAVFTHHLLLCGAPADEVDEEATKIMRYPASSKHGGVGFAWHDVLSKYVCLCVCLQDFLQVFGPYFQDVATTRTQFLTSSVAPLKTAQRAEVSRSMPNTCVCMRCS
jgi:hypothetical protein